MSCSDWHQGVNPICGGKAKVLDPLYCFIEADAGRHVEMRAEVGNQLYSSVVIGV